jgi:hypothetical protein
MLILPTYGDCACFLFVLQCVQPWCTNKKLKLLRVCKETDRIYAQNDI